MARIRTVKPEFWTDSTMVALPLDVRLFYIGIWNFADDYGVVEDDPLRLKLQILPADDVDVSGFLDVLVNAGRLRRATAPDGTKVLVIPHFLEHQKISHKAEPRFGCDPEDFVYDDDSREDSGRLRRTPEGSARKGREGKGTRDFDSDFDAWWENYPRRVDRKRALDAYRARRRSGAEVEDLLLAVKHYAEAVKGREPEFVKHGATFLNGSWDEWVAGNPEGEKPDPFGGMR